jgi:hypothetical protein
MGRALSCQWTALDPAGEAVARAVAVERMRLKVFRAEASALFAGYLARRLDFIDLGQFLSSKETPKFNTFSTMAFVP